MNRPAPTASPPFLKVSYLLGALACAAAACALVGPLTYSTRAMNDGAAQIPLLAPTIDGTPVMAMLGWRASIPASPPAWKGTDSSLRWTRLRVQAASPATDGAGNSWGAWRVGAVGQPLSVIVRAQRASTPLHENESSKGSTYIVPGSGFTNDASVNAVVDSGDVLITPNADGSATLTTPAILGDKAEMWLWAQSAGPGDDGNLVTVVSVGALPFQTVDRVRQAGTQRNNALLVKTVCAVGILLLGVIAFALGWHAVVKDDKPAPT